MQRDKLAIIILWAILGMSIYCPAYGEPVKDVLIVEGLIDDVLFSKIEDKKDFLSVTHLDFSNGQEIFLIGIHPGFSKGKMVKIRARLFIVISGISYYDLIEESQGIPPEPKKPPEPIAPGSP